MLKNRLFYLILVVVLVGLVGIGSAFLVSPRAVYAAAPSAQQGIQTLGEFCPFTAQEFQSLHPVYLKDTNVRMLETSDGPIGYDGGTFSLGQCRISK